MEKTRREQRILFFRMHGFVLHKTKKSEYYARAEERWPYEEKEEGKDDDNEDVVDEEVKDEVTEVKDEVAEVKDEVEPVWPDKPALSLGSVKGNCKSDRATVKKVGSLGHFLELLRSGEAATAAGDADGDSEHGKKTFRAPLYYFSYHHFFTHSFICGIVF